MPFQAEDIRHHLQNILTGSASEAEITAVVQIFRSIVEPYLGYLRRSLVHVCTQQGMTISDVTYDCIAEALARDERDGFTQIENFVNSLNGPLDTLPSDEIIMALRSFLTRVADAQLARLYALTDPAGAKIHRNIRNCVSSSSVFSLTKESRGLVLRPLSVDSCDDLQEFPIEELERCFGFKGSPSCTIPQLLKKLYDVLAGQDVYRRSVALVDVVQLFKKGYAFDLEAQESEQEIFSSGNLTNFEVAEICEHVEKSLKEKIFLTYLVKGKLTKSQAEAIVHAFHDMLADWCTVEAPDPSLHEYISPYLVIDERSFESELRPKMSYLLKFVRSELSVRLIRDL